MHRPSPNTIYLRIKDISDANRDGLLRDLDSIGYGAPREGLPKTLREYANAVILFLGRPHEFMLQTSYSGDGFASEAPAISSIGLSLDQICKALGLTPPDGIPDLP